MSTDYRPSEKWKINTTLPPKKEKKHIGSQKRKVYMGENRQPEGGRTTLWKAAGKEGLVPEKKKIVGYGK